FSAVKGVTISVAIFNFLLVETKACKRPNLIIRRMSDDQYQAHSAKFCSIRSVDCCAAALCANSRIIAWLLNWGSEDKSTVWLGLIHSYNSRIPSSRVISVRNPRREWILSKETR